MERFNERIAKNDPLCAIWRQILGSVYLFMLRPDAKNRCGYEAKKGKSVKITSFKEAVKAFRSFPKVCLMRVMKRLQKSL